MGPLSRPWGLRRRVARSKESGRSVLPRRRGTGGRLRSNPDLVSDPHPSVAAKAVNGWMGQHGSGWDAMDMDGRHVHGGRRLRCPREHPGAATV